MIRPDPTTERMRDRAEKMEIGNMDVLTLDCRFSPGGRSCAELEQKKHSYKMETGKDYVYDQNRVDALIKRSR